MSLTAVVIIPYALMFVIVIVAIILICRMLITRRRRAREKLISLELEWRKELQQKGIDPAEIEHIVEERKRNYILEHPTLRMSENPNEFRGGKFIICNKCGAEVPDTAQFCPHCGAKLQSKGGSEKEPFEQSAQRQNKQAANNKNKSKNSSFMRFIILIIAIVVVAAIIIILITTNRNTSETNPAESPSVSSQDDGFFYGR